MLVISPYSLLNRRCRLRNFRRIGCRAPVSIGASTNDTSVSFQLSDSRNATVTMIVAPLCSDRVTSSVISALLCAVSVRILATICPVLVRWKYDSGSNSRCR